MVVIPGSVTVDEWRKRHRVDPCFNTTNETVPPFACMQRRKPKTFDEKKPAKNTDEANLGYCQHKRGGQFVWDITKCNADGESRQDPTEFVFNGPVPIPPLTYGECTEDMPCQVLHNGRLDRLNNFTPCGPVKDQWYVRSHRSAFTCVSHDVLAAAGNWVVHTIWIQRGSGQTVSAHGRYLVSASGLATSEYLPIGTGTLEVNVQKDSDGWLQILRSGIYQVSLFGKLSSTSAPLGAPLSITLYKKPAGETDDSDPGDPESTIYVAERDEDIEQDTSYITATRTAENVAFSGPENLKRGDRLRLRNTSAHSITLVKGYFTLASIGAYYEAASTGGFNFEGS